MSARGIQQLDNANAGNGALQGGVRPGERVQQYQCKDEEITEQRVPVDKRVEICEQAVGIIVIPRRGHGRRKVGAEKRARPRRVEPAIHGRRD